MRRLVISTSSAACSIALLDGDAVVASAHDEVGRGHAERLLPMIAALPDNGRAEAIVVDVGPGSFTGVRVGLAAARALGLGWSVPVTGVASTLLIAAQAFAEVPEINTLAVVLLGGHGEVFVEGFARDGLSVTHPLASLTPGVAVALVGETPVFGSGVALIGRDEHRVPHATALPLLDPDLASLPPSPRYGRAPDAKLPA